MNFLLSTTFQTRSERLREELEKNHWGEWAVIVKGELLAVAPTMKEALKDAGEMPSDALSRLVRRIGEDLPKVVRKL